MPNYEGFVEYVLDMCPQLVDERLSSCEARRASIATDSTGVKLVDEEIELRSQPSACKG
jgi:hypothetical protein